MRRIILVIVWLVASSVSAGQSYVDIDNPKIRILPADKLPLVCNTDPSIRACTQMRATLSTACNAAPHFYEMSAIVRLTPDVFTATTALLQHEMAHVADVAALLRTHVRKLGKDKFETLEGCEAAARIARDTFAIKLQNAQQITDLRRDGKEPPGRAAQLTAATRADRAD
jgi:hypothetical protein